MHYLRYSESKSFLIRGILIIVVIICFSSYHETLIYTKILYHLCISSLLYLLGLRAAWWTGISGSEKSDSQSKNYVLTSHTPYHPGTNSPHH